MILVEFAFWTMACQEVEGLPKQAWELGREGRGRRKELSWNEMRYHDINSSSYFLLVWWCSFACFLIIFQKKNGQHEARRSLWLCAWFLYFLALWIRIDQIPWATPLTWCGLLPLLEPQRVMQAILWGPSMKLIKLAKGSTGPPHRGSYPAGLRMHQLDASLGCSKKVRTPLNAKRGEPLWGAHWKKMMHPHTSIHQHLAL